MVEQQPSKLMTRVRFPSPAPNISKAWLKGATMDVLLALGRIAIVTIFLLSGIGKFSDLGGTAAAIASKGLPIPQVLAIAAAAAEVIGGALIVVGWKTRWVAIGLLVYTAMAAFLFHDFWNQPEGPERLNQLIHAMKNLSIIGGFLLLAGAGPGRYSMDGVPMRGSR
jgi:putative oxidoreductase